VALQGNGKGGGLGGEEVWGVLGFVLGVFKYYFHCCNGRCLYQGLQGTEDVYSWYSRLVMGGECVGRRGNVMPG
jgi:hypothetical protein